MNNEKEFELKGTVDGIIFCNEDNGYSVFSFSTDDKNIVCTGNTGSLHEGEELHITGVFINHPSYGKQFNVKLFNRVLPTSASGMEKYLSSGLVKGIRARLAKRIVDTFKEETFKIIEESPERLSEIKGITLKKAFDISAVFHEQKDLRMALMYLQNYGISPSMAEKIYKKYKDATLETVKTNPYILADEIFGIGFKTADEIAFKSNIAKDSPYRIKSGIKYTLTSSTSRGHTFLPKKVLIKESSELLSIPFELIENGIIELKIEKVIVSERIEDDEAIFLNSFSYAESACAKKLIELSSYVTPVDWNITEKINKTEKILSVSLAENQKKAIEEALTQGVLVITGGPGTGKTTIIKTIIEMLSTDGYEIELAAPTGRAAKRMTETTGVEAKTIHRLLGTAFSGTDEKKQTFDKNEDNPIEADVIIIDESSMVDILLMHHLLKAIPEGTRLILVGDVDQLPSVGPGNVLKDIISSRTVSVVRLTEIFRQAQESAIIVNAHKINNGEYPILNQKDKDFFFIERINIDNVQSTILELITQRLPGYIPNLNEKEIQVLTPMRKSQLGTENLNPILQKKLNPPAPSKKEKEYRNLIFREGDKVMQLKNNYNLTWLIKNPSGNIIDKGVGVFNGDEGIVYSIEENNECLTVLYDENKYVTYDYTQLEELGLSYAVTIHKSQGSEYRVVIIPIHSGPYMLLTRNLLYTAITRAKELAVIIGKKETLKQMVDNSYEAQRYSLLNNKMIKFSNFLQAHS